MGVRGKQNPKETKKTAQGTQKNFKERIKNPVKPQQIRPKTRILQRPPQQQLNRHHCHPQNRKPRERKRARRPPLTLKTAKRSLPGNQCRPGRFLSTPHRTATGPSNDTGIISPGQLLFLIRDIVKHPWLLNKRSHIEPDIYLGMDFNEALCMDRVGCEEYYFY